MLCSLVHKFAFRKYVITNGAAEDINGIIVAITTSIKYLANNIF